MSKMIAIGLATTVKVIVILALSRTIRTAHVWADLPKSAQDVCRSALMASTTPVRGAGFEAPKASPYVPPWPLIPTTSSLMAYRWEWWEV